MDKLFNIGKTVLAGNENSETEYNEMDVRETDISIPLNNLRTHGLIVGMTGSGKTGLGISLLENLILNDLPLIIIDPKADLTNLLLPFDSEAVKKLGADEAVISAWQSKLLNDGVSQEIIDKYRNKLSINLFTPGDNDGQNLALWHFNPREIRNNKNVNDVEVQGLLERKSASLLELLSYDNTSIENPLLIYVSKLLNEFLQSGEAFSLEGLIKSALNPPFNQIGAIPLDIFCSAKERQDFALKLNSLLISSNSKKLFSGEELNLAEVLSDSGRAFLSSKNAEETENLDVADTGARKKVLLFSLRALDEKERMIFVENILSELIYQIRALDGSEDLRACFYMDEVYGYFPPIAMPPAKRSLITLIKQARSQGLSLILATQNPSDIDHKALSNISNIFIGRLNSETDRDKVISMILSNMNSKYSKDELKQMIASLQPREFIYCSAKDSDIQKFRSRQTISYLAGPLTAGKLKEIGAVDSQGTQSYGNGEKLNNDDQVELKRPDKVESSIELRDSVKSDSEVTSDLELKSEAGELNNNESTNVASETSDSRPKEEKTLASYFKNDLPYPVYYDNRRRENSDAYKPTVYASISVLYNDRNMAKPVEKHLNFAFPITDTISVVDFDQTIDDIPSEEDFEKQAKPDLPYASLPEAMLNKSALNNLQKKLLDKIYRNEKLSLYFYPKLKIYSEPDEDLKDFIDRCEELSQESLTAKVGKIDAKYDTKKESVLNQIYRLQDQIEKAKMRVDRQKLNTVVQTGSTILDLLISGGKRKSSIISKAGSSTKSHARSRELSSELELLEDKMNKLNESMEELDRAHHDEILNLQKDFFVSEDEIVEKNINLSKKDIFVNNFVFYWRS